MALLVEPAAGDLYLLRDLIWCGLCAVPLVTVQIRPSGTRYYGCPNRPCPRPLVPAEVTEQRAWHRFSFRYDALAHGVPRDRRQAVLGQVLKRVLVGANTTALAFEWRD